MRLHFDRAFGLNILRPIIDIVRNLNCRVLVGTLKNILHFISIDGHRCIYKRPLGGVQRSVRKSLFHGALDMRLLRV